MYYHVRPTYFPVVEKADRSQEYINCSQKHECRNWDWGRAVPFLRIFVPNFLFCVFAMLRYDLSYCFLRFDPTPLSPHSTASFHLLLCFLSKPNFGSNSRRQSIKLVIGPPPPTPTPHQRPTHITSVLTSQQHTDWQRDRGIIRTDRQQKDRQIDRQSKRQKADRQQANLHIFWQTKTRKAERLTGRHIGGQMGRENDRQRCI